MAWSDAARAAAAEARRLHAKTKGGAVSYGGESNYAWTHGKRPSGRGYWAFDVKSVKGATHQVWMRDQMYSQAKKNIIGLAKRVSAKSKYKFVKVKVLT